MNFQIIINILHHQFTFLLFLLSFLLSFNIDSATTAESITTRRVLSEKESSFFSKLFNQSHLNQLIRSIDHNPDHKLVKILPDIDHIIFYNSNNNKTNQQKLIRGEVKLCYDDTVDRGNSTVNIFHLSIGDIVYKFLVSLCLKKNKKTNFFQ